MLAKKLPRWRQSLAWRLTTTYLLTTLLIVLALSAAVYLSTAFYLDERLETELTAQADFYANTPPNWPPTREHWPAWLPLSSASLPPQPGGSMPG
jgi:hypothetical protein